MFRYPRGMTENNVPSTSRTRKSKALAHKRKRAAELGVTLIEGGLVAITADGLLNVYQWDEATGEYVATHASKLVALD